MMPDQQELCRPYLFDLYPTSLGQGEVRTKNLPGQVQRTIVTDRSPGSPYKIQAVLRTCVHGNWSEGTNRPTTLLVVDYLLAVLKEGKAARFTSVTTRFDFSNRDPTCSASPSIKGYAPFRRTTRFGQSTAEQNHSLETDLKLAPEAGGIKIAEATVQKTSDKSHTQQYFDRGIAGIEYGDDQNPSAVWWNMAENRSQQLGIPIKFSVAMLVERADNAKFEARFEITAKGGFGYWLDDLKNRFTRGTAVDDPIIFDPAAEPFGMEFKDITIDPQELGALVKNEKLVGLVEVEGLSPLEHGNAG